MADDDSSDALALTLRRWRWAAMRAHVADAAWLALVAGGTAAVVLNWLNIDAMWASVGIAGAAFALGYRRVPGLGETAAGLDRRFDSDDLFATAWASRRPAGDAGPATTATTAADAADGWRTTLANLAAARAAALPPPGGLGRRSVRQHLCVIVGVVTLAVAARLVPPPPIVSTAHATAAGPAAAVARPGEAAFVADSRRRAADTADEATRLPMPSSADAARRAEVAAAPRPDAAANAAGPAAAGTGRADAPSPPSPPPRSAAADPAMARAPTPGPAGRGSAGRSGAGVATAGPVGAEKPMRENGSDYGEVKKSDGRGASLANEVSAAYREMVREFFER